MVRWLSLIASASSFNHRSSSSEKATAEDGNSTEVKSCPVCNRLSFNLFNLDPHPLERHGQVGFGHFIGNIVIGYSDRG